MRRLVIPLALVLSGCLSSAPDQATNWVIDVTRSGVDTPRFEREYDESIKVLTVTVRQPYNGTRLVVLRHDGSVAFDAYNSFSCSPSALVKGMIIDVLRASNLFVGVLANDSSSKARFTLEAEVTKFALDCRGQRRVASVELSLVLMDHREIIASARASGSVDATADLSTTFSKATTIAIEGAVSQLAKK